MEYIDDIVLLEDIVREREPLPDFDTTTGYQWVLDIHIVLELDSEKGETGYLLEDIVLEHQAQDRHTHTADNLVAVRRVNIVDKVVVDQED